ncbi:phosphotransferase [Nocardia puris]|uniref:phosphotransferase n=1 Tax=Nocardia puris TaxID=208602 RepID=UPI002B4AB16C|nr:phosphotransferase [Nocardia puris]
MINKRRATLVVHRDHTVKTYRHPSMAAAEIAWYQRAPWATPALIDADPETGRLVIATHPPAGDSYRPVTELAELLDALAAEHIHHRDVHPGNILAGPAGPLLIDWETATHVVAPSYDLWGPDISGVPVPDIHTALRTPYVMWWASPHRASIRERWGADVPATVARRP